jgi:hypothetical protein
MDCYNCKFRGTVAGSAHSSCNVIRSSGDEKSRELELLLAAGSVRLTDGEDNPMVKLNPHGIKNGWAMWPLDFDPVWVDDCKFFNQK